MSRLKLVAMALVGIALASCETAPLTAPTGSTMFLQANPTFVIANGGISVVTAVLVEPAGTFVPDGTEVSFFTNLGRIDPVGKTVRGVASVNFVSDSRSGQATVTAISGAVTGAPALTIAVGSRSPTLVIVSADPPQITTPRNTRLRATVFDTNGNPVQHVPVSFSTTSVAEESLDSGGALLFTDSNGQVFDTLRTRSAFGSVQANVTVTALTANGQMGSATVFID